VPDAIAEKLVALKRDTPWARQPFLEKLAEVLKGDEGERWRGLVLARTAYTLPPEEIDRMEKILIELGREAIQENAQWLLLRRSKPVELPLGA
jgi:hypothetical protein